MPLPAGQERTLSPEIIEPELQIGFQNSLLHGMRNGKVLSMLIGLEVRNGTCDWCTGRLCTSGVLNTCWADRQRWGPIRQNPACMINPKGEPHQLMITLRALIVSIAELCKPA